MGKMSKENQEQKIVNNLTDVLIDVSDLFMDNFGHDVQNLSGIDLEGRGSGKQDTIDGPDVSLLNIN